MICRDVPFARALFQNRNRRSSRTDSCSRHVGRPHRIGRSTWCGDNTIPAYRPLCLGEFRGCPFFARHRDRARPIHPHRVDDSVGSGILSSGTLAAGSATPSGRGNSQPRRRRPIPNGDAASARRRVSRRPHLAATHPFARLACDVACGGHASCSETRVSPGPSGSMPTCYGTCSADLCRNSCTQGLLV